jgi:hypothetical protein
MEFGRKSDAKKAMKIAWKNHRGSGPLKPGELKKAWKEVLCKSKFGNVNCRQLYNTSESCGGNPSCTWVNSGPSRGCRRRKGVESGTAYEGPVFRPPSYPAAAAAASGSGINMSNAPIRFNSTGATNLASRYGLNANQFPRRADKFVKTSGGRPDPHYVITVDDVKWFVANRTSTPAVPLPGSWIVGASPTPVPPAAAASAPPASSLPIPMGLMTAPQYVGARAAQLTAQREAAGEHLRTSASTRPTARSLMIPAATPTHAGMPASRLAAAERAMQDSPIRFAGGVMGAAATLAAQYDLTAWNFDERYSNFVRTPTPHREVTLRDVQRYIEHERLEGTPLARLPGEPEDLITFFGVLPGSKYDKCEFCQKEKKCGANSKKMVYLCKSHNPDKDGKYLCNMHKNKCTQMKAPMFR